MVGGTVSAGGASTGGSLPVATGDGCDDGDGFGTRPVMSTCAGRGGDTAGAGAAGGDGGVDGGGGGGGVTEYGPGTAQVRSPSTLPRPRHARTSRRSSRSHSSLRTRRSNPGARSGPRRCDPGHDPAATAVALVPMRMHSSDTPASSIPSGRLRPMSWRRVRSSAYGTGRALMCKSPPCTMVRPDAGATCDRNVTLFACRSS